MKKQQFSNSSNALSSRNHPPSSHIHQSTSGEKDAPFRDRTSSATMEVSNHPPLHWEDDRKQARRLPHRTPSDTSSSSSVDVSGRGIHSRAPIAYQSGRVWSHPSSLVQYEHPPNSRTHPSSSLPNHRRPVHKRPLVLDASPRQTTPLQLSQTHHTTNHRSVWWDPTSIEPHRISVAVSRRDLPIFSPLSPESPAIIRRQTKPSNCNSDRAIMAATDHAAAATVFARNAAHAGFLQKTIPGSNAPVVGHLHLPQQQTQRFFVVQPATHLYEFESSHDAEPCDCWDLEHAHIEYNTFDEVGSVRATENDHDNPTNVSTRHCITISWENPDGNSAEPEQQRRLLHLEARSQADADLWMKALEQERLSHVKHQLTHQQKRNSAMQSRISELERTIADLRCIEQDRDDAASDAARYQSELNLLDEAIRQLILLARREPDFRRQALVPSNVAKHKTVRQSSDLADDETGLTVENSDEDENDTLSCNEKLALKHQVDDDPNPEPNDTTEAAVSKVSIDLQNVPGTHFSALFNAVDQLRENWHLASSEAATAVDDVLEAQERVKEIEKRMAHAETHLCQIWEDNCALRKALKQKKREKRVLVREIKNTRAAETQLQQQLPTKSSTDTLEKTLSTFTDDFLDASDEEKLIQELEDHVISSIRLHEALLTSNGDTLPLSSNLSFTPNRGRDSVDDSSQVSFQSPVCADERRNHVSPFIHPNVPLFEPLPAASLFDECDEDESDDTLVDEDAMAPSSNTKKDPFHNSDMNDSLEERPNPLLILNNNVDDQLPQLCEAFSESESSRSSSIARRATSTLSCPLADVVTTTPPDSSSLDDGDVNVYHLTFYSRKIGIQFQRVPPPPVRARGLLTEAMTDERRAARSGEESTATELRRIAAISNHVKSTADERSVLELAKPVDAVLVCGFDGFDDTGSNRRPNFGARLVAFDGVSIEVGKWTFDAVRKAIQARCRPLTLSFRNDYLTTEQRTILTKSVQDVVSATTIVPTHENIMDFKGYRYSIQPSSFVESHRANPALSLQGANSDDEISESATECEPLSYYPQSFSGTRSFSSMNGRDSHLLDDAHSISSSTGAGNFRSFSDVGSSTASVLSAVAPLVSNLLNMRRRREPFTPEYLRRAPESVEGTPQHQNFQSDLL